VFILPALEMTGVSSARNDKRLFYRLCKTDALALIRARPLSPPFRLADEGKALALSAAPSVSKQGSDTMSHWGMV